MDRKSRLGRDNPFIVLPSNEYDWFPREKVTRIRFDTKSQMI